MITIVPIYPTLLSIYADRGNVRVLEQRCAWRGIDYRVQPLALGADLDPGSADIILSAAARTATRCSSPPS